ncbi:MAG: hypothetical protein ACI965_001805 [Paraglaciecola sp.]|jgi:hypothetical protein
MNRSSKGFGLAGVLATVVLLIVAAVFSASAKSEIRDVSFSNAHFECGLCVTTFQKVI